ncbi:MAG: alpha/beta hydrolase [Rhizobiales bacterium]|nr:alpha/beta hydrolase [Hyphomicrobiales bacterium]
MARVALITLLAGALAGCSSRPQPALGVAGDVLRPDAASVVNVLAITTRRPSEDAALRFSGERTLTPRFAEVAVSIPKNRKTGEIQWPSGGIADPAQNFGAVRFEAMERDAFAKRLLTSAQKTKRHVLVFVHGYNTRFDEAVFRIAQIVHDSGAEVTPVLFSWASWASLGSYPYDRESAALGRDSLELLLAKLADTPSVGQVSVLAHSMGGWLTLETMRQMVIRKGTIPPKIKDVMLAAPDVDVDVAAAQGRVLQQARNKPRVTLFVSSDDKALGASRWLWGSTDRLGAIDPSREPYRSNLARSGVTVVDLSDVRGGDSLNHGKFAENASVVKLIGQRLASNQSLESDGASGGVLHFVVKGAAATVETVLTAPVRLGEQRAPESSLEIER